MDIYGFPLVYPLGQSNARVQDQINELKQQVQDILAQKADKTDYTDDNIDNPTINIEQSGIYMQEI